MGYTTKPCVEQQHHRHYTVYLVQYIFSLYLQYILSEILQ